MYLKLITCFLNDKLHLKLNKMNEENKKLTFEEKLEGWKYRMAFAKTIARIIGVIVQIIIAILILKK